MTRLGKAKGRGVSCEGMATTTLTERQREVLDLRLAGRTYQGIADELGISVQTIKPHLRNVARKLGVDGVDRERLRAAASA